MTLNEFLGRLLPDKRQLFDERLDLLSEHIALTRQFVDNINNEHRLPAMFWQDLVETLVTTPMDADKLRAAIVQVCRSYTHQGGAISPPWPVVYGRATTKKQFCRFLHDEGYTDTLPEARQFISDLIGKSVSDCREQLQDITLGSRYAMWATFDPKNPGNDPFISLPTQAEELSKRLGLAPDEKRRDMLLLIYTLPVGVVPCFPTIADAYAGGGWLLWFRPVRPNAKYGLTLPWDPNAAPCPEVIHKPITGETLHCGVRVANGR